KTVHDTTVKIVKDTIVDTLYNLNYGLVAYYNFNNGNLNDSSGRGNNIIFNNATLTSDRYGRAGNAYRFTGGAYMRVPNSSTLNPSQITLMAIVRVNGFYTGQYWANEILMKGYQDQSAGVYGLRVQPVSFDYTKPLDTTREMFTGFYGDNANAGIMDSSFLVHGGVWNTVVYTYDGFVCKLYVNGKLENSKTVPFGYNPSTNDLYIGKTENSIFPYYFDGAIDEIRIYSKALPAFLVAKLSTLTE
ncbi:MAG TPA: LamG domain-containing protein, partial [Puia sp.]|nr:LamG domain-containing protein [Puia sp.]